MNKNLTVNTLAKKNLKVRKKQYVLMIVGIILAMVFSSSVLFFVSCIYTSNAEQVKNTMGVQDIIWIGSNESILEQAKEQDLVKNYGFAHTIGYAYADADKQDAGVSIAYLDDRAKELSYISFIDGRYPERADEIALEKSVLVRLGYDAAVNDMITLKLLVQDGEDYLPEPVEKNYKLVGLVKNKRSNILQQSPDIASNAIPAAFISNDTKIELGGKERLDCYIQQNKKILLVILPFRISSRLKMWLGLI